MTNNVRMYALALVGATLAAIIWAVSSPIWIDMLRCSRGSFAEPAAAWTVVGSCFTVALSLATAGSLSRLQWLGFATIMVGAAIFATGADGT